MSGDPNFRTVIVVRCHTCEERLGVVPTVYGAEHLLWKHLDVNEGHDATWWTSTAAWAAAGV